MYAWALNDVVLEPYYEATVRSMAVSWHNFAFAAFDVSGTITLDKLPGSLWVQALTARVLGVHTWSLVLPQVVEGVLTVAVLHRAVRRLAGPGAALTAALVLAFSPAVVALNRANIPATLMILLLVLAVDAVSAAVSSGRTRLLFVAALWVGLAFHVKMLAAWLILPALAIAILAAAPGSVAARTRNLVAAGVAAVSMSLIWMTAVMLVPAGSRPYVDGSQNNSLFEQVFVYNGLGRFGGQTPLQVLSDQGVALGLEGPAPGWSRLLTGELGLDIGWLLPLALAVTVVGIIGRRRASRHDGLRLAYMVWGSWLITFVVVFSVASSIQAYYTAALAPAIAAVCGVAFRDAWVHRHRPVVRLLVAGLSLGTAGYTVWLLPRTGVGLPSWLAAAVGVLGAVALIELVSSIFRPGDDLHAKIAFGAAACAVLTAPAVACLGLVAHHQGAYDTPFESHREFASIDALFVGTPQLVARSLPELERIQAGSPIFAVVQSAAVGSVFSNVSGQEVVALGGFTATAPVPTLEQLRSAVARGDFHLALLFPRSSDPRALWITRHCTAAGTTAGLLQNYDCQPIDAGDGEGR